MRFTPLLLGILCTTILGLAQAVTIASAQATPEGARSQSESGLTVTAEVFCSQTKLRTANARLRWSLSSAARAAAGLTNLAAAKPTLETTVFAGGFDKGLYVSLAVPGTTPPRPVAAVAAVTQARQKPMRAYQIQLIEIEPPRAAAAPADGMETSAVIENLEPGVNYTWRVVLEPAAGRLVSAPVTVRAPICPADIIPATEAPRRRP